MENSFLDSDNTKGLELNEVSKDKLTRAAKWAKFLAIMLFINSMYLIYKFVEMTIASRTSYTRNNMDLSELIGVLIFIGMIVFTFFAAYNLWNFANSALLAIKKENNKIFAISIESLKSYFKFYGLFLILVAIVLSLIFFVFYYTYSQASGMH